MCIARNYALDFSSRQWQCSCVCWVRVCERVDGLLQVTAIHVICFAVAVCSIFGLAEMWCYFWCCLKSCSPVMPIDSIHQYLHIHYVVLTREKKKTHTHSTPFSWFNSMRSSLSSHFVCIFLLVRVIWIWFYFSFGCASLSFAFVDRICREKERENI